MKKLISLFMVFTLLIGILPVYAQATDTETVNLLKNGDFEGVSLSTDTSWKFPDTGVWYAYGTLAVSSEIANGTQAVQTSDGILGQKVPLETGKTYRLEVQINPVSAAYIDVGFFNTSAGNVKIDNSKRENTGEWETVTVDYTCTSDGSYVVGVYNRSKKYNEDGTMISSKPSSGWPVPTVAYVDDIVLYEIETVEATIEPTIEPTVGPTVAPNATPFPEVEGNLLKNGTFEGTTLNADSSWLFANKGIWYAASGNGDPILTTDVVHSGDYSVWTQDGMLGQKIALEGGKLYRFEVQINTTAEGYVDIGFFNGSTPIAVVNSKRSNIGEWETVTVDFECQSTANYVVAVYNRSKKYNADGTFANANVSDKIPIYIDDAVLYEVIRPENEIERIKVHNKTVYEDKIIYNVSVPNGTQGDLIAAVYNNENILRYITYLESSTTPQVLEIPIEGIENGKTVFYLWDSIAGMRPISLPSLDEWTAKEALSTITLSRTSYPLYVGDTNKTDFSNWAESGNGIDTGASFQLTAAVESEQYSASDIKWTVSNSSILFMNDKKNGTVSLRGTRTGYAIATATLPDGANASCYITVMDNYNRLQVERIELNTDRLTLEKDSTASLVPIFYPKDYIDDNMMDKTLIWSTSDEEVATVDADGIITAVGNGNAIITATSNDVGRTASCSVTVADSVKTTGIEAVQSGITEMAVGETVQLEAISDSNIIWESENSYIADVDKNGVVTAYANSRIQKVGDKVIDGVTYEGLDVTEENGTVKIYATTEDGGCVAEYEIQVNDAPVTAHKVSINTESISIPRGENANITAVVSPSRIVGDAKNIEWSSDNESVVTVTNGDADTIFGAAQTTLTAVAEGTATVTAKRGDLTDTCTITVTNGVVNVTSDDIVLENHTIDIDEVYQFIPQAVNKTVTNKKLMWLDSDETIATIDNEGNVMGYKSGDVTVYAIAMDSLTDEQIALLEDLKYNTKTIGTDNEKLNGILESEGVVYKTCILTVENPSDYLRNLHISDETITDNSINLLWNRSSLLDAENFDHYTVYCNGNKIADTDMLGYTVNGLEPETEYTFNVIAVTSDGTEIASEEVTAETKLSPSTIINVLEYGAKGNGLANDTYAIQKAIDDCPEDGMVWLPGDGHFYYTGALFLKDNMTFKVDGIILGSINPTEYPMHITLWEGWRKLPQSSDEWANSTTDNSNGKALPFNDYQHSSLINAGVYDEGENSYTGPYNAENITICGEGMINANGFTLATNEGPNYNVTHRKIMNPSLRGRTILMHNAQDVYIKDVMTAYSPSWTNHIIFSDSVTFDNVSVISMGNGDIGNGWNSIHNKGHIWNGDGIDPDSCTNMNLFNLYLMTGDDAITLKSGRNKEGNDRDKPCAYIRMTDCHGYETLAGYGAGSEIASGAHDILMQNMSLNSSYCYGIWIKTMKERGGVIEDFTIRDFYAQNVNSVVYLDGAYTNTNPSAIVNPADTEAVIRNFVFENVNSGDGCRYDYRVEGISSSNKIDNVIIRGGQFVKNYSTISNSSNFEIYNCSTDWDDKGNTENINIVNQ